MGEDVTVDEEQQRIAQLQGALSVVTGLRMRYEHISGRLLELQLNSEKDRAMKKEYEAVMGGFLIAVTSAEEFLNLEWNEDTRSYSVKS